MKEVGESECGHCSYTMEKKSIFVGEKEKYHFNGKPWSQLRRESILVPAQESYAPMITYMINACKKMNCDDEVNKFRVKLDSLDGIREVLSPSLEF